MKRNELRDFMDEQKASQTLSLAYAGIGDDGVGELGPFVGQNVFVKHLDLRGNSIQPRGAVTLASGIKINRSLRGVNLKGNMVGKDISGIQAICDVLKSNMTISHLNLRNNKIGIDGARSLGGMLASNTTITHLDVSWNHFGVDGGVELLNGLKQNNTLVDCQVAGCKVGENILHEVAFLLRRNRSAALLESQKPESPPSTATLGSAPGHIADGKPTVDPVSQYLDSREMLFEKMMLAGRFKPPDLRSAPLSKREESSLILRLMIHEREQALPDEKLFFQQVAEHIEQCKLESAQHKEACKDAEEREKFAVSQFVGREQGYNEHIHTSEESIKQTIVDKEDLQEMVSIYVDKLREAYEDNAKTVREAVMMQENALAEEEHLRQALRDIVAEKRIQQDKLALGQKDLELLEQENARLRAHAKVFKSGGGIHTVMD
eukprot:gnl/MRDRNA2_/MRDRNA2_95066_c0_seq1.p1 gnl/MRDRNA2_/MRDRNA2_95066_c0~~gnl/MRDRNA2_/MRDRNA2_95066_c0_seq1.p1  ORF type:complete len:434 (+),score=94.49 gnl/MRDRNA2_/MRDRNA2_95066_c0_seq1:96-1397(+)